MQQEIIGGRNTAKLVALASVIANLLTPPAVAQEAYDAQLPEVKVEARHEESASWPVEGYAARRSATATKTDAPLHETPQAVTVVSRERIEDQGALSLQDALNYAAGVRSDAYGLDSRTDSVRVRSNYPDEYRDGLRRLFGYYTSNARTDPYALERIEVLRGPSGMLYGQGTTGGVINMVSKRPLEETRREIGLQYGSFDRKQLQTDLTGPLTEDGQWLYRLVALGRESDTQVDYVRDDRALVAPSLTWRPSADTSLTLQATWQSDRTGSTSQFFPWSGMARSNPNGRIPTDRFIGQPGFDHYDSDRFEAGWLFEHRLDSQWTVRQNLRYSHNEVEYFTLYSDSFSNPQAPYIDAAQRMLNRFLDLSRRKNNMLAADQHLEGHLTTGPLNHQLLLGVDLLRFREESQSAFDLAAPIDVYNPTYTGVTAPPLGDDPKSRLKQTGFYVQDQIRIDQRWIVVAGVRRDRATSSLEGSSDDKDQATTRRLGFMYLMDGGWAPYLSYSESFTPLASDTVTGRRFEPMRGKQIEAGLKWEQPGGNLVFTTAAYDLRETKRQIEVAPNVIEQLGKTRTRGVELELLGRVLPGLEIAAHYNYTDIDEQLEALPRNQAALWGTQRFTLGDTPGFMAGLGVRYMSDFKDGVAPTTPSVTLFDAMFGFDSGRWRYALNVQNLTDKTYLSTCLSRGDCWYGARRTIVGSVSYRF